MLIHMEAFVLAFFGCAATNIDNLLLLFASGSPNRARKSSLVFVGMLLVFISLGLLASYGIDLTIPRYIVWLGLIPFIGSEFGLGCEFPA